MPLQPNGGKLLMPAATEADVSALFDKALELSQTVGFATRNRYRADIEDHFYYIGAICPQHFRPLQHEAINLASTYLSFLNFSFPTWLYLLQDTPDSYVEQLMQRLIQAKHDSARDILETMLAAIGTPTALTAMAEYAERSEKPDAFRDLGFWLPGKGKSAEPRFTRYRRALRFQAADGSISMNDLTKRPHPVGLPISYVAEIAAQDIIAWHYLTLDLAEINGLPQTTCSRIHLVSPVRNGGWTLFSPISPQNRYTHADLYVFDEEEPEMIKKLQEDAVAYQDTGRGELILLPYDDQLVYSNGHTQMTAGVYGDVGGPPPGLNEPPCCPTCQKLMFHVCTVSSTLREYGDGFRSLFLCEACMQIASQAMGWN